MRSKDFTKERHQKILEYVNSQGRVQVEALARVFNVTETTIRRDLFALDNQELIYRAHGGALKREQRSVWQMSSLQSRLNEHKVEKERIAIHVAQMIHDGESIMIDGGSTTTKVAQELSRKKNLLIVTNALTIGELLLGSHHNKVILTGGELLKETNAMIGNSTEYAISRYRTDKAIIGVSGFIPEEGCFAAIPQEAEIKKRMLQNAQEKIIVTDSSKIGAHAFYCFCDINEIDILVTDNNIKKNDWEILEKLGIKVFVV